MSLDNRDAYAVWREAKLANCPDTIDELIVEVDDPRRLTDEEHAAILQRCQRANMAIYAGKTGDEPDKQIPKLLGERFGLRNLDHNVGADDDAISMIAVQTDATHRGYIPYTNRPLAWHTDGYYNLPERQIHAFILHCVAAASEGGENSLIDPEMAYIRLRDRNPEHIRALMHSDAMSIPPNVVDGVELRPQSSGPVFTSGVRGRLHMRYTDRRRNIDWRSDPATSAAVSALREILNGADTPIYRTRLEPGWGLICNNVLHSRDAFNDKDSRRQVYRARYYERIEGT